MTNPTGHHRPEAHSEHELVQALEPDQLSVNLAVPLPRMELSRSLGILFWVLRIFVVVLTVLVLRSLFRGD